MLHRAKPVVWSLILAASTFPHRLAAQAILDPTINVRAMGIRGDGISDDTDRFTAALATHKLLYIPAGTYILKGALRISTGQSLMCASDSATVLKFVSAGDGLVSIDPESSDVTISACRIYTTDKAGGKAIAAELIGGSHWRIRDCYIGTVESGRWQYGLWAQGLESSEIDALRISGNILVGVHLRENSNANTFVAPLISGPLAVGFETENCEDNAIIGGTIEGAVSSASRMGGKALISLSHGSGLHIEGSHIENHGDVSGIIADDSVLTIDGIEVSGSYSDVIWQHDGGFVRVVNLRMIGAVSASGYVVRSEGNRFGTGGQSSVTDSTVSNIAGRGLYFSGQFASTIANSSIASLGDAVTVSGSGLITAIGNVLNTHAAGINDAAGTPLVLVANTWTNPDAQKVCLGCVGHVISHSGNKIFAGPIVTFGSPAAGNVIEIK